MRHVGLALIPALLALSALGLACSGRNEPPPPPPPPRAPPGQVLVTVSAGSTPPGATVTGGGRHLGTTPFTTQVPVPEPAPGEVQTFEFTFQLPGHEAVTITASPVNNTITVNATLRASGQVAAQPGPTPTPESEPASSSEGGRRLTVRGSGGGPIVDNRTTTSTARVGEQCTIADLDVEIAGTHTYFSDLEVRLRGPDGEVYQLQSHTSRNPFRSHSVRRAAGHPAGGTWTLSIADTVGADSGQLRGFTLRIRCR